MKSLSSTLQHNKKGFTLIEVMAALAVVAVGIAAAVGVVSNIALNTSRLEEKIISQWLISNRMVEIRLQQHELSPSNNSNASRSVTMAGREWFLFDKTSESDIKNVFQSSVKVCTDNLKTDCPMEKTGYFSNLTFVIQKN
jgi:general secretion pathway protein I